jgi:hypothetical protein
MATVDYMHICDYAFLTQGGKPSMIGLFEGITAATFPAAHPHMSVAFHFLDAPHAVINYVLEIGRPNGEVLSRAEQRAHAGSSGGAFVSVDLVGLPFPEAGRYVFKVVLGGRTLASRSLHVEKITQAAGIASTA